MVGKSGPFRLAAACAIVVLAVPASGGAAPGGGCPVPSEADPSLANIAPRARLAWIDGHLGAEAHRARWWTWGWGGVVVAGGVGSLVAVPFVVPENRVDYYTGAVSAVFAVIPFVIFPLPVLRDAPRLHADVAGVDDARLCATLSGAEDALVRNAREERLQRAWWVHAGNIVFNTGVLLFLGLGYHHWAAGLLNAGPGLAVGEAMIFTSPTGSIDDLAAYRRAAVPDAR